MAYLNLDSILRRLQAGAVPLSDGEVKTLLKHLVDQVNELSGQIESLRRSEPTRSSQSEDSSGGVRRGRKPKHNQGEAGQTPRDA